MLAKEVSDPRYGSYFVFFTGRVRRADLKVQKSPVLKTKLCSGTDVMIFEIFSPKNSAKNWRF
jgi:hypothetical protein